MATSAARTVEDYLAQLPEDRRADIEAVRDVVRDHLPPGYEETMSFGAISWVVPLERSGPTYNKQPLMYASLAAQKNYSSLYLMGVYGDPEAERALAEGFTSAGKRLDMGKSCVRFKRADDLALDAIADSIARVPIDQFIARAEAARTPRRK